MILRFALSCIRTATLFLDMSGALILLQLLPVIPPSYPWLEANEFLTVCVSRHVLLTVNIM